MRAADHSIAAATLLRSSICSFAVCAWMASAAVIAPMSVTITGALYAATSCIRYGSVVWSPSYLVEPPRQRMSAPCHFSFGVSGWCRGAVGLVSDDSVGLSNHPSEAV